MAAPRYFRLTFKSWHRLFHHWQVPYTRLTCEEYALSVPRSVLAWLQEAFLKRSGSAKAPIVVIGFWRSGTTLLHELLAVDDRFCFPTNYDCFNAHKFVLASPLAKYRGKEVTRRPQDSMPTGWNSPQEDEFALLALGARSPYEGLLAPKRYADAMHLADVQMLPPKDRALWERSFLFILRGLNIVNGGKPAILKSPAHGYRIPTIRKLFPDAKFIVIVRNPHEVFSSWIKTYRSFTARYGIGEGISDEQLKEATLQERLRYEEKMRAGLDGIPKGNVSYLRYEDLVQNPLAAVETIYRDLEISDFGYICEKLKAEVAKRATHVRTAHIFPPHWKKRVEHEWREIFERYGYPLKENPETKNTSIYAMHNR